MLRLYLILGWMKEHRCGYSNPTGVSLSLILLRYSARKAIYFQRILQLLVNQVGMIMVIKQDIYLSTNFNLLPFS